MVIAGLRLGFGCELNLEPEMKMAGERMALIELIEKGADADLVRERLTLAADRMMELEVEAKTGVPSGARSPIDSNHRNGYREHAWDMRAGRIDLAVPKLRKGSGFPFSGNRAARPRRHSPRSSRRPISTGSRPARSTTWSRLWA